jgi:hypothetical protein
MIAFIIVNVCMLSKLSIQLTHLRIRIDLIRLSTLKKGGVVLVEPHKMLQVQRGAVPWLYKFFWLETIGCIRL